MKKVSQVFVAALFALNFVGLGAISGEARVPALFSDGAVLQRADQVSVWGWAAAVMTQETPPTPQTAHFISTPIFQIRIKDPGFCMEVSTLKVTDTITGSPVSFTADSTTGAIRFNLHPGHSYALSGGAPH